MKKKDHNALGINLTQQKFAKSLQRVSDLNNLIMQYRSLKPSPRTVSSDLAIPFYLKMRQPMEP